MSRFTENYRHFQIVKIHPFWSIRRFESVNAHTSKTNEEGKQQCFPSLFCCVVAGASLLEDGNDTMKQQGVYSRQVCFDCVHKAPAGYRHSEELPKARERRIRQR